MLRIERVGKRLLAFRNFRQKPIAEFFDLTDFIVNSPEEFFGEIGEEIYLIGSHARLGKSNAAQVDLLGVDSEGAGVALVVEASSREPALSRAITAASRLASWDAPRFFERLPEQQRRGFRSFLGASISNLNQRQRVFIVGEKADSDLMSAAAWLDRRGVDIVFVEAALGLDPRSGIEYLQCRAFNPHEKLEAHEDPDDVSFRPAPTDEEAALEPEQENAAEETAVEDPVPEPDWEQLAEEELLTAEPAPPPKPQPEAPERRSTERTKVAADRMVEVEYASRRLGAHLTDFSEVGVALEMNSPLPIGSTVVVMGDVETASGRRRFEKKGRVRYCRFEDQGFRLGIAFEQAA